MGWSPERYWIASTIMERLFGSNYQLIDGSERDWILSVAGEDKILCVRDDFFLGATERGGLIHIAPEAKVTWIEPEQIVSCDSMSLGPLPVLFPLKVTPDIVQKDGNKTTLNIDIFGMAFWLLSRLEEHQNPIRDPHDRYSAFSSHAWRNGYLMRPILDEWLVIFRELVYSVWARISFVTHSFKMILSHDVDDPFCFHFMPILRASKLITANAIKSRNPAMFLGAPLNWLRAQVGNVNKDPCNTFDWIMDCSENIGVKSTFYFIAGHTAGAIDGNYDLGHLRIRALIRHIYHRGHRIGLHPSYDTYKNSISLTSEYNYLRRIMLEEGVDQENIGARMHYLRWHHDTTAIAQEIANIAYDTTLGYADHPGFRCGTCFEYAMFNLSKQCSMNLKIRPLVAMECTVLARRYMNLGATERAQEVFSSLKSACRRVGGQFTLLWHNSQFFSSSEKELYSAILLA